MIFVTVGTQLPFDRLIAAVDDWIASSGRSDVFAQTCGGTYTPVNMRHRVRISPAECREYFAKADVVVAHAGMGTIISAIEAGKPLVIMPRRMENGEHRNDHQVATCERFNDLPNVFVAEDERELPARIEAALATSSFDSTTVEASAELLGVIRGFLEEARSLKQVDGVICFGGVDWWYHNRGHYDLQMMREFSRSMPVLYVNPIGMRTGGSNGGRDLLKRAGRKFRSWSRGLALVRENFGVLSPVSLPASRATRLGRSALAEQVMDAAKCMGIEHPLLWVACPPAAEVVEQIPASGMVYQRTDRMEHVPGVNAEKIRAYDLLLKKKADLTLFCSTRVFEDEQTECRRAAFIESGVDYEQFSRADQLGEPADLRGIARPRIGFIGEINSSTFDPALFNRVASQMPDCNFVVVGGCALPAGWCELPNVHFLGRKPYEEVASYMAACDVLIMPWNRGPWIEACNPVKLKEYLAVGKPVVSTPFHELERYDEQVAVARTDEEFVGAIRRSLENPPPAQRLRERVVNETWSAKATAAIHELLDCGIAFRESIVAAANASCGDRSMQKNGGSGTVASEETRGARERWRWPVLLGTAIMAIAGLWVTQDAWSDILRLGLQDEESSHVLLAVPAALWIGWSRRTLVADGYRTGVWIGPAIVALGWALYTFGDIYLFQSIWHFGAICIVVGCIASVVGSHVLLRLWPAFAVLLFLIPVPAILRAQIAPPMQTITAQLTAYLLQTAGEPVTLSGKVLNINDVSVGIAEACNGIRMVFALALVCFFYAFSTELSTRARTMIILASPVVAIVVNIVRLVPTVWLYGHADRAFAESFHDIMGWAMMPVALFGLMGIRAMFSWALQDDPDDTDTSPPTAIVTKATHPGT